MSKIATLTYRSMKSSLLPMGLSMCLILSVVTSYWHIIYNGFIADKINLRPIDWLTMIIVTIFSLAIYFGRRHFSILCMKTADELINGEYKRPGFNILDFLCPVGFIGCSIGYAFDNAHITQVSISVLATFTCAVGIIIRSLAYEDEVNRTIRYIFNMMSSFLMAVAVTVFSTILFPSVKNQASVLVEVSAPQKISNGVESGVFQVTVPNSDNPVTQKETKK